MKFKMERKFGAVKGGGEDLVVGAESHEIDSKMVKVEFDSIGFPGKVVGGRVVVEDGVAVNIFGEKDGATGVGFGAKVGFSG